MTAGWRVEITPRARRDLRRIDPPVRQRITDALDRLIADPPIGDVVKLTGREEWRLRVGDWRVRFRLDSQQRTVVVHRVLPRGRAYHCAIQHDCWVFCFPEQAAGGADWVLGRVPVPKRYLSAEAETTMFIGLRAAVRGEVDMIPVVVSSARRDAVCRLLHHARWILAQPGLGTSAAEFGILRRCRRG